MQPPIHRRERGIQESNPEAGKLKKKAERGGIWWRNKREKKKFPGGVFPENFRVYWEYPPWEAAT